MAVTVDPKSNKLIIRFRVKGHERQFYLSTGLKDNKSNRAIVESRWELIQREISLDEFDSTLDRYRFGNKTPKIQKTNLTLNEIWDKFCDFKFRVLKPSTIYNYGFIGKIIDKLPQNLESAPKAREELLDKYSYHVARRTLNTISSACDWAVDSKLINQNPFKNLKLPKQKSQQEDIKAFTLQQRDLIISSFESSTTYSHYTPLVKFLFFTGCRPGEAFALQWSDISGDRTKISITKSYSTKTSTLGATKNNKKRVFPCGSGSKLQILLMSISPPSPKPDELVFKSTLGQQVNLRILWRVWFGYWSKGKNFHPGLIKQLAEKGKIPYLTPYSTRHTFATWAISSGASPEKVAYWLGDNVATVLQYYCHPDVTKSEAPDF